jgi:hypothetical protein
MLMTFFKGFFQAHPFKHTHSSTPIQAHPIVNAGVLRELMGLAEAYRSNAPDLKQKVEKILNRMTQAQIFKGS